MRPRHSASVEIHRPAAEQPVRDAVAFEHDVKLGKCRQLLRRARWLAHAADGRSVSSRSAMPISNMNAGAVIAQGKPSIRSRFENVG